MHVEIVVEVGVVVRRVVDIGMIVGIVAVGIVADDIPDDIVVVVGIVCVAEMMVVIVA